MHLGVVVAAVVAGSLNGTARIWRRWTVVEAGLG